MPFFKKKKQYRKRRGHVAQPNYAVRRRIVTGFLLLGLFALTAVAVERQVFETDFLQSEGKRRYVRAVEIPTHRGMVTDRQGEPLALSTPIETVWANPKEVDVKADSYALLAKVLGVSKQALNKVLFRHEGRQYVYLKRQVNPDVAEKIRVVLKANKIKGVYFQREYRRYYPAGEVSAHLVGFTGNDDKGQEGLELAYNSWLTGIPGAKRVLKDGSGRFVGNVESIRAPQPGRDLQTSLDRRIQFLAYRELKAAVKKHRAKSGSVVVLDVKTGEVLAMVNQPSYNPNARRKGSVGRYRNRAITDVFEPGSTLKPFAVAAALEVEKVTPETQIDTAKGIFKLGRHVVRDSREYGVLDVSTIIQKSSNIGVSKIALMMEAEEFWSTLAAVGFGEATASGFPGEASGRLPNFSDWSEFEQATLAFGYGLSVTPLQLAQAYGVIAADGRKLPISLQKIYQPAQGERVLKASAARDVRAMLERVVSKEGTAPLAAVAGYRVAGKTGTAKKIGKNGYAKDKYLSIFAGMLPASNPRLVMVVMINEPRAGVFYGGQVAAPVFSKVMTGAMRLLNIPPDGMPESELRLAGVGEAR